MLKRRSNEEILLFIAELPGGNPQQYAKLLNTTAMRISTLLHTKEGEKLARKDLVVACERGQMPTWSFTDKRGALRGRDVDDLLKTGKLPGFILKMLDSIHPQFRDDALNFLREALDQTGNHHSFEDQMSAYMSQDKHRTDHIMDQQGIIAARDAEISRFDYVIEQARSMANILEDQTQRLAARPATPSLEGAVENRDSETVAA